MPTISIFSDHLGVHICSKQNERFGRKNCHFRRKKQPFRPKIDIIEYFDALKCNFLSIFAGMATRVHTQTQYFGYIQVKISQGAKKKLIFGAKMSIFGQKLLIFLSVLIV